MDKRQCDKKAIIYTDEAASYKSTKSHHEHKFVGLGSGEYGRRRGPTDTIEGYSSIFKCGMKGVYQLCGKQNLHRYLAEYNFRYNNRQALKIDDSFRMEIALAGVAGKRLMYRDSPIQP